jgi:N-acetylglucosamine malate deacetylase 2
VSREPAGADPVRRLLGPRPPRVLLLAPHPDDETLGAGALLARLPDAWVLHATDGLPRDPAFVARGFPGPPAAYAEARFREAAAALDLLGVPPERRRRLGLPDQGLIEQAGLLAGALEWLFQELAPGIVLLPAYEGGHPDHDAVALAARVAADALRRSGHPPPDLVEMALYHARPEGAGPAGSGPVAGRFLPAPGIAETLLPLGAGERELKRRALARFETQRETLAGLLAPGGLPAAETFRPAPRHDFTRPPHEGRLQYERWGFAMDGEAWRRLARELLAQPAGARG